MAPKIDLPKIEPPDHVDLPDWRNYDNAVKPSDPVGSSSRSFNMDWLGTALGAAGGLFSSFFSNRSINKQIKAQQRENELNRQFNSAEAQKSRDFASLMFDRENAYNDPKAVIQRLQSAGINPALAYGSFADSSSISSNAEASSGGSITPSPLDTSGIVSAGQSYINARVAESQASLNEAQASRIRAETPLASQIQQSVIDLNKSGVKLNLSKSAYTDEDRNLLPEKLNNLKQSTENLRQTLSNLKSEGLILGENYKQAISETHIKQVMSDYAEKMGQAQLDNLIASTKHLFSWAKLNDANAAQVAALTPLLTEWYQDANTIQGFEADQYTGLSATQAFGTILGWKKDEIEAHIASLQAGATGRDVDWLSNATSFATFVIGAYLLRGKSPKAIGGFK